MKELTEAQWRWVNRGHTPFLKMLPKWIFKHIVIYGIVAGIIWALFFQEQDWPRNLTAAISIGWLLYALFIGCCLILAIIGIAVEGSKTSKKLEGGHELVKGLRTMVSKPWSGRWVFFNTYRVIWLTVEYGVLVCFIAYGWVVWGLFLIFCNIVIDLMALWARSMFVTWVSKRSPAELERITGGRDSFICKEILDGLGLKTDTDTEVTDDGTKTKVKVSGIPQSAFIMTVTQDRLSLGEEHYSDKIDHLTVDLSSPTSIDKIEELLRDLVTQRKAEAS